MEFERFVGLRYLLTKKRSQMVSIITLIAIAGVALGVTAMIVVLSVMGGFEKDLKEKILGTKAHIIVTSEDTSPLADWKTIIEDVRDVDGVVGASPYIEKEVMGSSPTNLSGVVLRGIDPSNISEVSRLKSNIVSGKLDYLRDTSPLLRRLEKERKKDIQGVIDDLDKEKTKTKSGESPDSTQQNSQDEDDSQMRPIFDNEASEGEGEEDAAKEETGKMPSLTSDASADEAKLPGLILGSELAKSLKVDLGQEINVVTPEGDIGPTGRMPSSRPFVIVGIFKTGMYEYDANQAYTHIDDARDFIGIEGVTGIEIKTKDVSLAEPIANKLQKRMPEGVMVQDWRELNQSLFFALRLEKMAMFIVLAFIILVASFSIVAMLVMTVIEKSQDISVLKAMGASSGGVMRIFVFQGTLIGVVGAFIGLGLGLAICWFLASYGLPLNSRVYYISKLPVEIDWLEIGAVLACTLVISVAATLYPSFLAAKLNPIEGLRDE